MNTKVSFGAGGFGLNEIVLVTEFHDATFIATIVATIGKMLVACSDRRQYT
jgi:hypothetical protein